MELGIWLMVALGGCSVVSVCALWVVLGDPARIARDVESAGGSVESIRGSGWKRLYRVQYRDGAGVTHRGECRVRAASVEWIFSE